MIGTNVTINNAAYTVGPCSLNDTLCIKLPSTLAVPCLGREAGREEGRERQREIERGRGGRGRERGMVAANGSFGDTTGVGGREEERQGGREQARDSERECVRERVECKSECKSENENEKEKTAAQLDQIAKD